MANVLVVDDSVSVRKALERILLTRNLEVSAAGSAEEALTRLGERVPDIMIADVVMPGMDGFGLCKTVKDDARYSALPVLLISGIVNQDVLEQAGEVGALGVVKKPFTPEDIFPKVEAALAPAARAAGAASVALQDAAPAPDERSRAQRLGALLEPFVEKSEVQTAFLIDASGKGIARAGEETDEVKLGTYCRTLGSIAGVLGEGLKVPPLESLYLDYHEQGLLVSRVRSNFLVLVLSSVSTLSMIRYLVSKQMPKMLGVLDAPA